LEEQENTFRTSNLVITGDFNADYSSEHITKKHTTQYLLAMIEDFHVIDIVPEPATPDIQYVHGIGGTITKSPPV
jgi:endonuclease/exonuclease/phosphatase family metal-dependent hydrolase